MMLGYQSSNLRTKVWQGIRSRHIEKIKQDIRQLYHRREQEEEQGREQLNQKYNEDKFNKGRKHRHSTCQLCECNNLCNQLSNWSWHFLRDSGQLCRGHQKQVIDQCVQLFRSNSNFLVQVYSGLDFQTSSFVTVQRSLYLTAKILSLFLADPQFRTPYYEQSLCQCPVVEYMLDGWFEYRLSQVAEQMNCRDNNASIRFMQMLLRECKKILVGQFVWIVVKKNWRIIQQMVGSTQGAERILGLTSILCILNNLREKHNNHPEILEVGMKENIKWLIIQEIVDKSNIHYLEMIPEIVEVEIEIVYLCMDIEDQYISLRNQASRVLKWVNNFLPKVDMEGISASCRPMITRMLEWRVGCYMDEQF